MANEEEKKNQVLEYLELIDVSSEDDFLIAYPFYDSLEDLRLSGYLLYVLFNPNPQILLTCPASITVSLDNINGNSKVFHKRNLLANSESPNRGRRPSFMRRSLAWDSAFFTSAGVLDQEELSVVNKGFNNVAEAYLLPGIQEEVRTRRSDASECMYDSDDGFGINSLDCDDPFEDVRASIDKSNQKFRLGKSILHKLHSSKKADIANRSRIKSTPISKSHSSIKPQQSERYKMEPHTPISKLRKLSGGVNAMSSRKIQRDFLYSNNVKSGNTKTKRSDSVQDLVMFKSPSMPLESCSKFSITASANSAFSTASYDTLPSSASKYTLNSRRRKMDSRFHTLDSPGVSTELSLVSSSNSLCQMSPCFSSFDDGVSSVSYYSSTPLSNLGYLSSSAQSSTSQENQGNNSKRSLKPSGLRMPSPKIGFFEEQSVGGNAKFQFEVQNSDVVSRSAECTTRIRARKAANVQSQPQDNHSPLSTPKMKTSRKCPVTDSMSRSHPVLDRGSCAKIRKVGSGERDRRNTYNSSSLKSAETRIKSKGKSYEKENLSNVDELSKHLEVIDISKDNHENESVPRPNSSIVCPTGMGYNVGLRTPLADRSFVRNRRESREISG